MKNNKVNTLIVIVGPTAIGKTSVSIEIAKHFNTEIISADSRQFYKELKIGTAVPTKDELNTVKHYFIGNLSINDYYNVYNFEVDAIQVLEKIFLNNKYAILTGGSGLYIGALCSGIDLLPDVDEELRADVKKQFEEFGIAHLRKVLKKLDPEYYNEIDLANPKRLMRAIEICLNTGEKYSELRKNKIKERNFNIVKIGLNKDRKELYNTINKRVDIMLENGLIKEAKSLYKYKDLNALNTVGYKELFHCFDNSIDVNEGIEKIKTNSRRYAKRQLTWFRRDNEIQWFHPSEFQKIIDFIEVS